MTQRTLHTLPLGQNEEALLLAELREGTPDAFNLLYHHYVGRVLGLTRQILRDPVAAEDAAQEAFIRIYRNLHRFRGDSSLATWIHRITTNVCLTELDRRKRRSDRELEQPANLPEPTASAAPPREVSLSLGEVLGRLQPRKRITFYLCHVEGLTAAEIASVLGEKRSTVLKRLQRTRLELLDLWHETPAATQQASWPRDRAKRGMA